MLADLRGTPRFEALGREEISPEGVRPFGNGREMKLGNLFAETEARKCTTVAVASAVVVAGSRSSRNSGFPSWKSRTWVVRSVMVLVMIRIHLDSRDRLGFEATPEG